MSWKCDKCHKRYEDSVVPAKIQGFKFCGNCLLDNNAETLKVNEKNKKKKARIIFIAAAVIFGVCIAAGVVLFKADMHLAIPIWTAGFVAAVVLSAIGEAVEKRK